MPIQEVLIMAVTEMLSGVCIAGYVRDPAAPGQVRWVRPVKLHDTLLLGDITDAEGRVIRCGDVVELALQKARPEPPHVEDWLVDWVHHRPFVVRRLEGERRSAFLRAHLDPRPGEVIEDGVRSLCLVHPEEIWAYYRLDHYTGKYEARMGFTLGGASHEKANSSRGIPVTDLAWRALGRQWLEADGGTLELGHQELAQRLAVQEIYLALGLSRAYQGQCWLLVVGVHPVPELKVAIDYRHL